jgi:hypothetical protein
MMFLFLLACTPLSGNWSGEVDCGDYAMDLSLSLEAAQGDYEGEGLLDCTDYYGADCAQTFNVEVETDGRDLDVDLDDCYYYVEGYESQVGCDNPDDVEWNGGREIDGEWADCDVELERV